MVTNSCQQTVECGPCCDPPCGTRERCTSERTCEPCAVCCQDVCCAGDRAICHADNGECCVPDPTATTCAGKCGEIVDSRGVAVDCGPCGEGLACAACAALDDPDVYDREADCGGDLACDCGQIVYCPGDRIVQCKRPGVRRPNHAPVALDVDVTFPWKQDIYSIGLNGYVPDSENDQTCRIVTLPQYGSHILSNDVYAGEPGTSALPAPPLAPGTPTDCFPHASTCSGSGACPDCEMSLCPEGPYWDEPVEYVPFSSTFTGTDSFTYAAVDVFGAEGPPAQVAITIFKV